VGRNCHTVNQRPHLKPVCTDGDKFVEILAFGVLVFMWTYCLATYAKLPDTIPTHFTFRGEVDECGSKSTFWLLPGVATLLYCVMTGISFFPWKFNFPVKITLENALRQYTLSIRMLRYLKLVLEVTFAVILLQIARAIQGGRMGLGFWFLPLLLGLTLIPSIVYVFLALRGR
jgi:uncharacterized membrane protein